MNHWVALRCLTMAAVMSAVLQPPSARAESAIAAEQDISIWHDRRQRTASVYVPHSYHSSRPAPLVLMFHGGGGNADNAARTSQMQQQADRHGLIVVYPNGTGVLKETLLTWNTWNCCGYAMQHDVDDVGFVRELIATLKRRYAIDRKRIYATGLSNGAMMAHRIGCELSDQIAAIAPVAGALNADSCVPRAPVSVVIFHGTADEHVLFEGGRNRKHFPGAKPRVDRSVEHAFTTWAQINGCQPAPPIQHATNVAKTACIDGIDGAEVVLYAIEGQGHAWPGGRPGIRNGNVDPPSQQISATDVMIEFFLRHPKQ